MGPRCWGTAALALGGCKDGTGIESILPGTFVLTRIDGNGPPLVTLTHTFSNGARRESRIAFDSLKFTSETSVRRHVRYESVDIAPDGTVTTSPVFGEYEYGGTVTRRGGDLIAEWQNPFAPAERTEVFHVRAGELARDGLVGLCTTGGCAGVRAAVYTYTRT